VLEHIVQVTEDLGVRMTTTLATDYESAIYQDPIVRKRGACAAGREATNLDHDAARGVFVMYGCSYSPASDLDAPPSIRRPFVAGEFSLDRVDDFMAIWRNDAAWPSTETQRSRPRNVRLACTTGATNVWVPAQSKTWITRRSTQTQTCSTNCDSSCHRPQNGTVTSGF